MKRVHIAAIAIAAVALTGCSSISSGTITDKQYEKARTYTTLQYCGKACFIPIVHHDDPDWRFDISDGDDEGYVYVSNKTYDEYEVGDYYENSDDAK